MKVLCIGAHPDDVCLGMGGTKARLKVEGHEVQTMIYGKGRGDKLDQRFDTIPLLEITHWIETKIDSYRPDVVYSHSEDDVNEDHKIIYKATLTATRPLPNSCVKEIYSYEVVASSEYGFNSATSPDIWVNITEYFEEKLNQLRTYDEEMREWPHPRSYHGIEILAKYRGMQVGLPYAEAFKIVRIIK